MSRPVPASSAHRAEEEGDAGGNDVEAWGTGAPTEENREKLDPECSLRCGCKKTKEPKTLKCLILGDSLTRLSI